jgi:multisubunit Na+/H+ antiporter MnhC subunit
VIGFGVHAFAMVLFKRLYQRTGADDVDFVRETENQP